ncbi:protease, partial [Clostridioides difficile]
SISFDNSNSLRNMGILEKSGTNLRGEGVLSNGFYVD